MKGFTAIGLAGILAAGVVTTLPASDVSAQERARNVRIQMQSAYPSTLKGTGDNAVYTAQTITKVSGGALDVRFFEPGALVPGGQIFDAVSSGALDSAWASPAFWTGKDVAFSIFSSVPFGPDAGEYLAWMKYGGGEKMMQALYAKYNIHSMLCNFTSPEAGGWFRKEINTVEDLKGIKMRFLGLGSNVMQKLGVSTQLLQAGEIFQALQLGTIDATEFSTPSMDLSLGFYQVAKFYYFPGWHQQASFGDMIWNKTKWDALPDAQKAQATAACDSALLNGMASSESAQMGALKEIQSKGVQLKNFDPKLLDAFRKAWDEVAVEQSARSPEFKKAWDSLTEFRAGYSIWRERAYLR
ncbi:MAG: TRAP transporter substrate-binding protein [Proteobacteria bacterium]|nr:TRAP transporter substrate-binding protein [Pseudomonadota bacterium]